MTIISLTEADLHGFIVWRNKQFLKTQKLVTFNILMYTIMSFLKTFLIA